MTQSRNFTELEKTMKKYFCTLLLASLFSLSAASNGKLCLTFDDRFFDNWLQAVEFFKKYDAKVTFFVCGKIDRDTIGILKKLQSAGHSIGLHALKHTKMVDFSGKYGLEAYTKKEIIPQLEICRRNNIKIRAFAYPYSQRSVDTDKELFKNFDFLRTNCSAVKRADTTLAQADGCFVKNVQKKQLFYGFPASGKFDMNEVKNALSRAAKEDAVLVFYAHNIKSKMSRSHHISYSQLTQILDFAKSLGLSVCGMNEL